MMGHMKEIKNRFIFFLIVWCFMSVLIYFNKDDILGILSNPLQNLMPDGESFIATHVAESFLITVKLIVGGGFILSIPFGLYQVWRFLLPALYYHEKIFWRLILFSSIFLFFAGAVFAHNLILPFALIFLKSFSQDGFCAKLLPSLSEYLGFYINLIFAFALSFELPVLLLILGKFKVLQSFHLEKSRRIAIVAIFVFAAIITPPDILSQICLAVPLVLFYEIVIHLIKRMEKKPLL